MTFWRQVLAPAFERWVVSGKASRDKGGRREREMVAKLNQLPGVSANRVPLSGAMQGYKGDLRVFVDSLGRPLQVEVKARAKAAGWTSVKQWLGENDLLLLVEDRTDPLVVLPWSLFEALVIATGMIQTSRNEDAAS